MKIEEQQQIVHEIESVCEKYGYELINVCLYNPKKKEGEQGEFLVINRVTVKDLKDLTQMAEGQVKH